MGRQGWAVGGGQGPLLWMENRVEAAAMDARQGQTEGRGTARPPSYHQV